MTNVVWKWRSLDNEARARVCVCARVKQKTEFTAPEDRGSRVAQLAACYPRLALHFLCDVSGELIPLAPAVLQSWQEATRKDLTSHPTPNTRRPEPAGSVHEIPQLANNRPRHCSGSLLAHHLICPH